MGGPEPGNQFDLDNGGSEFFLSSDAVFSSDGTSTRVLLWTMTNTSSLNTVSPSPSLSLQSVAVLQYAVPPRSKQKTGELPLSECIADTVIFPNCNILVAGIGNHNNTSFGRLNSNDSRMQQVFYANGAVWGALDTAVTVSGSTRAVYPHRG